MKYKKKNNDKSFSTTTKRYHSLLSILIQWLITFIQFDVPTYGAVDGPPLSNSHYDVYNISHSSNS